MMTAQTVTRAIECPAGPEHVYALLTDVSRIPAWAPAFADRTERIDAATFRIEKDRDAFTMHLVVNAAAGTVDYVRDMPGGRRGGAYIRVTPRPLDGCSITMTVPLAAAGTEDAVAAEVERELAALVLLCEQ